MDLNQIKVGVTLILLSSTLIAYQNCSRAQFTSDSSTSVLKLANETGVDPAVIDGQNNQTGIDPNVGQQPTVMPTPSTLTPGKDSSAGGSCKDKGNVATQNLIECEIMAANSKVILAKSDSLGQGSNAQVSRVCMSENACIKLVNDYAAARGCKLSLGKSDLNSQTQCAKIFPGSKGTCNNATVMSDTQIKNMLAEMGK